MALAERLEELVSQDEGGGTGAEIAARFQPFLRPQDSLAFLADPVLGGSARASRAIAAAESYLDAIAATWGAVAVRIAADLALGSGPAARDRLERKIVAVAGICAVPVAALALPLETETARRVLAGLAQAVEAVRDRLIAVPAAPAVAQLYAELERLLRRKRTEVQATVAALPSPPPRASGTGGKPAGLEWLGALLALRGENADLADDLAAATVVPHRLLTPAVRLGLAEAELIDQRPILTEMHGQQRRVDAWITEAVTHAAKAPAGPELEHRVDRIAIALGALRTLCGSSRSASTKSTTKAGGPICSISSTRRRRT